MKKFLSLVLLVGTMLSAIAVPVNAARPDQPESAVALAIEPRLNNGNSCNMSFIITSSGLAEVSASYAGITGVTSRVTITMSIEKKVSSSEWERIDIGTLTNSWTDSSTNTNGSFCHNIQLESKGTYRGVFVIRMFGSGGTADKIEKTIEKTYS